MAPRPGIVATTLGLILAVASVDAAPAFEGAQVTITHGKPGPFLYALRCLDCPFVSIVRGKELQCLSKGTESYGSFCRSATDTIRFIIRGARDGAGKIFGTAVCALAFGRITGLSPKD